VAIGKEIEGILDYGNMPFPASRSTDSQRLYKTASYIAYQFGHNHPLPGFIEKGYAYHHGADFGDDHPGISAITTHLS
ncbi:MAG: hypothetical protein SPK30_05965, partial [Candidatus Cryptobacteroides sp.]|nr:hypothetical protein [Bacteroidales bacterium]MDY5744188.1 hypothetical protein [Candidatus Cryptobacteroides sp.]